MEFCNDCPDSWTRVHRAHGGRVSLARDGISPDAVRAVAELAQLGRGSLEKRARDLARALTDKQARIAELELLLVAVERELAHGRRAAEAVLSEARRDGVIP